jgi:hypothetical protein
MKHTIFVSALLALPCFGASVLLDEHDYDANNTSLNSGNTGVTVTTIADPTGSGSGNVGSVDISDSGTVWGEVRPVPNGFTLPAGTTAGVDTLTASFDIYVPSGTTFSSAGGGVDRVNLIIRQSSGPDNGNRVNPGTSANNWNTLLLDQWQTITVNTGIAATDSVGAPITELTPIISFYDPNTNASPGVAAYIDNWSFSVTNVPEPTSSFLMIFAGLGLLRRRR